MSSVPPSSEPADVPPIRIENLLAQRENDPPRAEREGLPPSFRMRADSHYVDLLDSSPPSHEGRRQTSPARRTVQEAADSGAAAGTELERSLSALSICSSMLADSVPNLARLAAVNVVRAEICRARCLLHVLRVSRDEAAGPRTPIGMRALVDRVLQAIEPERRLRNVVMDLRLEGYACRVAADEELLASALSAILLVAFGVLGDVSEPRVTVKAQASGEFTFAVAFENGRLPIAWTTDAGARSEPAGDGTALLAGARRIVERFDGRLTVTPAGHGGDIRISLPRVRDEQS